MDRAAITADPVISCDGRPHALRTVFRKPLNMLAGTECHIRKEQTRRLRTLPRPGRANEFSMMSFIFFTHILAYPVAQTSKSSSCKGRKLESYRCTTCYCIPTYAFPITGEIRQSLLQISACDSGVIFEFFLLVSGSHHPRIAATFEKTTLSITVFTSYIEISILEAKLFVKIIISLFLLFITKTGLFGRS